MRDIEQGAGLELLISTLGLDVLAMLEINVVISLDSQVDMVFWTVSGKDGLEAVVASGRNARGAALVNKESMFEAITGTMEYFLGF